MFTSYWLFSCSGACEFTQLRLTDLLRFPSSKTLNKPVPQAKEWMLLVPGSLWSSVCIWSIRSNGNRTAMLMQVRLASTPALSLFILLTFSHKPGLIGGVWWHRQRELFKGQWVHPKLVINMTYLDSWSQHPLSLLLPWGVFLVSVCTTKSPVADMSRVKSHMQIVVWKLLSEYSSPLSEEQRTQSRSLESKRD